MQQRPCSNLPPGSESKNANGGTSSICLLLDDAKDFVSSLFLIYEAATIDIRSRREPRRSSRRSKSDLFLEATGLIGSVVCVYWVLTCFLTWLSSFFSFFFFFSWGRSGNSGNHDPHGTFFSFLFLWKCKYVPIHLTLSETSSPTATVHYTLLNGFFVLQVKFLSYKSKKKQTMEFELDIELELDPRGLCLLIVFFFFFFHFPDRWCRCRSASR